MVSIQPEVSADFPVNCRDQSGCLRVVTDDKTSLCEKYSVDFVPTVLIFEKGKVTKRLDAEPHEGLSEAQLRKLLAES